MKLAPLFMDTDTAAQPALAGQLDASPLKDVVNSVLKLTVSPLTILPPPIEVKNEHELLLIGAPNDNQEPELI